MPAAMYCSHKYKVETHDFRPVSYPQVAPPRVIALAGERGHHQPIRQFHPKYETIPLARTPRFEQPR